MQKVKLISLEIETPKTATVTYVLLLSLNADRLW